MEHTKDTNVPLGESEWTVEEIADQGERVSHLHQDFVFFGHLSIYDYATRYCQGARVLDVGCGAGYGAAYLLEHGAASVVGVDASAKAIAFCRQHFPDQRLSFLEMRAEELRGFDEGSFDFIYTSNTLEHIGDVEGFLHSVHRLLRPGGTLLIAVPPITDDRLLYLNLINPYHVNLWSPRQWVHRIGHYFVQVTPVLHGVGEIGKDFLPEHLQPDAALKVDDFRFAPGTVEQMYQMFTLTAIFIAQQPRSNGPGVTPVDPEFIDGSFSRPPNYIDPAVRRRLRHYFPDQPSHLRRWLDRVVALLRRSG